MHEVVGRSVPALNYGKPRACRQKLDCCVWRVRNGTGVRLANNNLADSLLPYNPRTVAIFEALIQAFTRASVVNGAAYVVLPSRFVAEITTIAVDTIQVFVALIHLIGHDVD